MAGETGPRGLTGSTGATGVTGAVGIVGASGTPGPIGDTGESGFTGVAGQVGHTGAAGDTGHTGPAGMPGIHSAHTHTCLTAICLGLPRWVGTRKVKSVWTLLKQETLSGSGISWAICVSAPRSIQITTPAPH